MMGIKEQIDDRCPCLRFCRRWSDRRVRRTTSIAMSLRYTMKYIQLPLSGCSAFGHTHSWRHSVIADRKKQSLLH